MTAIPQTVFKCDRCLDTASKPIHSVPVHARADGPEGWLILRIGSDPSTPPSHLCPPCAFGFNAYMQGSSLGQLTESA
jgi:hypothetical protein